MPITTELQNVRELKEVGFTEKQADKLAELFERSLSQGFEKFAELLDRRLVALEARLVALEARMAALEARMVAMEERLVARMVAMEERLEARIDARSEGVRTEFYKAAHDNLMKIFALVVGTVSLAVAIIKLFPNWY